VRHYKVLCFWDISFCPWVLDKLKEVADVDVREPDRQYLLDHVGEYDAYLASLHVRFDAEVVSRAKKMKVVATPSTGLDHLDLEALAQAGIELQCIKTEFGLLDSITATAEMAWCLMLSALRHLPHAHNAAMQGRWARDRYRGHQISGMTLGILGVGRLGSMMADYGKAFRMRVLGCDRSPRHQLPHVQYVDFDTLLRESDILTIHIHLTDDNRHLIDKHALAKMKDGVCIVNTSRGAIIKEDDFVQAIRSGKVGAAGLDVIEGEWRPDLQNHPLIQLAREHDSIVISPHLGGITVESQAASTKFVADRLGDTLRKMTPASR
jgi:D-3-phosphoglycerate dehydrogenase